jgi:hypothetical protein
MSIKITIPYEWKLDLEKNRTGANIHDSMALEGCLMGWLCLLQKYQNKKDRNENKIKYFKARIDETLEDGFKKGLLSYKYELMGVK